MKEFLEYILRFGNLNQQQIDFISSKAEIGRIKKNDYIAEAEKTVKQIVFILESIVRICYYDNKGDEITKYFFDKNPQLSEHDSWRFDIYNTSPAPKTLLKITDTGYMLGGIMGWDALETNATNDENLETLRFIQQITTAYLRSKLDPNDKSWDNAVNELAKTENPKGKIEVKTK